MDLSTLNAAQRAAVTAPDGAHLVIAGAGTGKTRTLVHRVAWLLQQGVPPREIALLTFTRLAAGEMLERVGRLAGGGARHVRGGTFHGFANTALRRYGPVLGYTPGFTILDSSDAQDLVGLVRNELGLGSKGGRRFPQKATILNIFSKRVNTGRSIERILDEEYPQYLEEGEDLERLGDRYAERKLKQDVMDFDDLLVRLAELLRAHPEARRRLSESCRHVLVDEYQDTNRLQGQIACMLASSWGNLMVVGDEAQSIYRFRGAAVENILEFPSLFPACGMTLLEQNYRSTQPILDLANGVLDSAREGYDKRLRSDLQPGDKPVLVEVAEESEQPAFVVERVLALREAGVPLREIAVLFRSGQHGNLLELELQQAGLPFRKFGGIRFVEAAHIKDVFALLRLVANPRDAVAWVRVLQWFEGLGATTAERTARDIADAETPRLDPALHARKKYAGGVRSLVELLDAAQTCVDDVPALLDLLLAWYRPHLERLHDDFRSRARDLDTLTVLSARYPDLQTFLAEVTLDPPGSADVQAKGADDEWLTLSTIHSAKGLEWEAVFVLQLADGQFPSIYALDDDEAIEEERRLFYVAVTRARRHLFLLRPGLLRTRGGMATTPGCRLLDDVAGLRGLVTRLVPASPAAEKHPDLSAAEDRMKRFLAFYK